MSTASAPAEGQPSHPIAIEEQRKFFTSTTPQYFTLLSSVDVNLRRQIYALEEAEILPAEAVTKELTTKLAIPSAVQTHPQNASLPRMGGGNKGVITGGGLGNLDVGWLNSRNDHVGKEMNSELWREAEIFVLKLEGRELGVDRKLDLLNGNGQEEAADAF